MPNPVMSSYLEWLAQEETNAQQQTVTYRAYYEGDHPTLLTDRQAAYLNIDRNKGFSANCTAVVVDAAKERLQVTGFDVLNTDSAAAPAPSDETAATTPDKAVASLLDIWWKQNRMDAVQDWIYQAALRDREAFIIVSYDAENKRPSLSHDFAYDGTNGVKAHCVPGTYNKLAFASKRWVVSMGGGKTMRRLNMYFPNRIEKWVNTNNGTFSEAFWQPYLDPDDPTLQLTDVQDGERAYQAAVAWWTDNGTPTGKPLGVPVIPFRNRDDGTGRGMSEIDNAIPFQDGINKVFVDLLAAGDMTGWQMFWTNGVLPDNLKTYPGAMIPVRPELETDGSVQVGVLPAGDLTQLIGALNAIVGLMAGVTGTPQSRFTPSVVRPSADTQKQEEAPLVSKVQGLQKVWGNSWEDAMLMCLKVEAAFGKAAVPDTGGFTISTQWKPAEIRNEKEHIETIAMKVDKLKIPEEQGWREAGYSADQIAEFKEAKARREQIAADIQRMATRALPAQTATKPDDMPMEREMEQAA